MDGYHNISMGKDFPVLQRLRDAQILTVDFEDDQAILLCWSDYDQGSLAEELTKADVVALSVELRMLAGRMRE